MTQTMTLSRRFAGREGGWARPPRQVPTQTGPLEPLVGQRILAILDCENLSYGSRDLGFHFAYDRLAALLRNVARTCALHAFFSREPGDAAATRFVARCGWVAHPYDIQTVRSYRGTERLANSDGLILFTSGLLASHSDADVVVLASGDGALVSDLARFLRSLPKPRRIVTLSLAGSTSWRLDARRNPAITANIEIGRDCLRPVDRSYRLKGAM
ncbi:MAG: hypothetical protein HRU71_12990 [Planctomycetia bacterium]|nr:MAG: hypothetical protein HRU71_12990 [Planctomycetia bacterium]